ncbi:MAG: ATP-binding protein [Bacteroidales bacterium]|nr:ATP-binding protein [Bacteroidales bacterium]
MMKNQLEDISARLAEVERENAYLRRKLKRLKTQQWRQEKLDEMNRYQAIRANSRLEEANAIADQANKAKTEFLANMSHEIRTPLNIVLGMGELLSETALNSLQKQYLHNLRLSGKHLLELINNILDFSRIESGSVDVEFEPFSLGVLLKGVDSMISHLSREKGIEFLLELEQNISLCRIGDAGKIKQSLLNLLGNAIKFTACGSVVLRVYEIKNDTVMFEVRDTGKGIPEEQQAIIFERFAQVEDTHLKNKSGVGLGLAITQRLVTAMGGEINFKSGETWGSVFSFCLPLPTVNIAAGGVNNNVLLTISPERMPQLNVLVVDDVSLNIEMIASFLNEYPVAIDRAENGQLAVELFKKNKYDLILMDIRMPLMDGSTAMQRIREIERSINSTATRIVTMTAHAFREQRSIFLNSGFDEVLTKPFTKNELLNVLIPKANMIMLFSENPVQGNKANDITLESETKRKLPPEVEWLMPELMQLLTEGAANINQALEQRDFELLTTICHSVKGVAGMYGFKMAFNLIEGIERSAVNCSVDKAQILSSALSRYIDKIS